MTIWVIDLIISFFLSFHAIRTIRELFIWANVILSGKNEVLDATDFMDVFSVDPISWSPIDVRFQFYCSSEGGQYVSWTAPIVLRLFSAKALQLAIRRSQVQLCRDSLLGVLGIFSPEKTHPNLISFSSTFVIVVPGYQTSFWRPIYLVMMTLLENKWKTLITVLHMLRLNAVSWHLISPRFQSNPSNWKKITPGQKMFLRQKVPFWLRMLVHSLMA